MLSPLVLVRSGIFAIVISLSLAVLGLSAHWAMLTSGTFFGFEGLGIVAGGLSAIILSILLAVGMLRKNAIITIVGVELPVVFVLSALFLGEGVITSDELGVSFPPGCDPFVYTAFGIRLCKEMTALKSISFALFAIMASYWLPLLFTVLFNLMRGQNILNMSVLELTLSQHTQEEANQYANAFMEPFGAKDPSGGLNYDQSQQQQIQMQQLRLQQLQQQQVMLQQQYPQQYPQQGQQV